MADIATVSLSQNRQVERLFENPSSPEGSFPWYQALAEATLDSDEEAILAVAFEAGVARAALPLVRRGHQVRGLTAPYTTLYAPALPDAGWAQLLGKGARAYVQGSLHLEAVDPAEPGMAAFLDGLNASGLFRAQYQHFLNFFEPIDDFEQYWEARPSRLKATVRRKLTQAHTQSAEFRCYRKNFALAIEHYEEIYRASWKRPEPHPRFIPVMIHNLAREGLVRLSLLLLSGKAVAAQIWLICGSKATLFKLAHREDATEYSPGTLLTHWMISTLTTEEGVKEIDFGRGGDAYKGEWLGRARTRKGLVAAKWENRNGISTIAAEILPTHLSFLVRESARSIRRLFVP